MGCVLCIRASIRHFFSGHAASFRQHSFELTTGNIPNDRRIHVQKTSIVFIIYVLFKIKLYKKCIYCLFISFSIIICFNIKINLNLCNCWCNFYWMSPFYWWHINLTSFLIFFMYTCIICTILSCILLCMLLIVIYVLYLYVTWFLKK